MSQKVNCPRPGCGTETTANDAKKLVTHKLPDGWRTCAASGATLSEAAQMAEPSNVLSEAVAYE